MRPALIAGLVYALALLALGVVLGAFRTFLIEPWLGAWPALLIELPVILYGAWRLSALAVEGRELDRAGGVAAGIVALIVLLIAEALLSQILSGRSLIAHFALYADPRHQLGLAAQVLAAGFPLMRVWTAPPPPPPLKGEVLGP
ncbi:hypothetical protein F1654_08640 [Alkalicaulis satelles]|uniref:Uncharacterized protein n=1 Tax=Alkalicaulis satelles TaxID=2609175 RepID=A0A5M6ZIJ6_9PROT|nr:hypothetical protein [Alkalicaulis satelles]KAA5803855.1 hypothetical protein F1654_08640 [Alkalicaulis satelles]